MSAGCLVELSCWARRLLIGRGIRISRRASWLCCIGGSADVGRKMDLGLLGFDLRKLFFRRIPF